MYEYRADVIKVVDGDTVWLSVDLGFDIRRKDSFRLAGINAPETSTNEGVAAKEWLAAMLELAGPDRPLAVHTLKDRREKYGRYLAVLMLGALNLNEAMVEQGHAVPYDGGVR